MKENVRVGFLLCSMSWNTKADGTGLKFDGDSGNYADMESIKNLTAHDLAELELFAQWTPNQYTVSFDKGIGTITGDTSKTVIFDETYGTLPTLDNKTGYTALGW